MDLFLNDAKMRSDAGIMEKVKVMQQRMHLPHVNLLRAEAWLWEESKPHIKGKVDDPRRTDVFAPIIDA